MGELKIAKEAGLKRRQSHGIESIACLQKRLERNERDIAQFWTKLHSYRHEPKTYAQFLQTVQLKEKALALKDANAKIAMALRTHTNVTPYMGLLAEHQMEVETFSHAVRQYFDEAKLQQTVQF